MTSHLRFVPNSSAAVPIDWSKVPEKSKRYFRNRYYVRRLGDTASASEERPLPQTIGGLAESFHERKFFDYMGPELSQLLLDISQFGLEPEKLDNFGLPVGPRFYMRYDARVWFLLFTPGDKDKMAFGFGDSSPYFDEDDEDELEDWDAATEAAAKAEKDREAAEIFDKKLVDEVSRMGTIGVLMSGRLAGWEAYLLKRTLEEGQLASAMMSLPQDHPVLVEYTRNAFASLRR